MKNLGFTRICREIADVAIYAHYPESFCSENLAIRKVFAFSDSETVTKLSDIDTDSATTSIHLHYLFCPLGKMTPYQSIKATKQ